jgi:hypothetical protein
MQAKKVLIYTDFDPATDESEADLWSDQDDHRVNKVAIGWAVDDALERLFKVMEEGDSIAITIEVVEDAD